MMDDVEPQLVELELSQDASGAVDLDMVNSIFRLFHSMKGSAGFLELTYMVKLTHKAENLLDIFRKEEAVLAGPDVTLLLKTIDLMRKLMEDLEESGKDDTFAEEIDAKVELLQKSITAKLSGEPIQADVSEVAVVVDEESDLVIASEPESEPAPGNALPGITVSPEMHARYLEEAEELLDSAEQNLMEALNGSGEEIDLAEALRCLHSFKGNSGFMGYMTLEKLTHRTETMLEEVVAGTIKADEASLSVFLEVVDVCRQTTADQDNPGVVAEDILNPMLGKLDGLDPNAAPKKKSGFIPLGNMKKPKPAQKVEAENVAPVPVEPVAPPAPPAPAVPTPVATAVKPVQAKGGTKPVEAARVRKAPAAKSAGSIRVDISKLDSLMNLVGELVIAEAMVTRNPDLDGYEFENLEKSSHHLRRITSDLQDVAMSVRMVPLAGTFKKMIRLVHDTGIKAGKKVELKLIGEETEVDKTVIEQISDPLVHIVRNAIDHGLENPEERALTEKSEAGLVTIEARHESGEVWIIVSDDGKGLPRQVILDKAISKGLVEGDGENLRDEEVYKLIFEPGFSTAAAVTEISGRGVGMDVVKKNIEKINGRVDIKSNFGFGSSFIMRIPLTMAIIEGMLVRVGRSTYNVPLLSIREAFRPDESMITTTPDGVEVVKLREDLIPVVRLHELYKIKATFESLTEGILVIVENDGQAAALFVDEILGQQQTVVKGLSEYVGSPHGVSGCTILGDGRISLILDVATILSGSATAPVAMV
jgi:two-component system, chemotaxis family, sensor kinase CheA